MSESGTTPTFVGNSNQPPRTSSHQLQVRPQRAWEPPWRDFITFYKAKFVYAVVGACVLYSRSPFINCFAQPCSYIGQPGLIQGHRGAMSPSKVDTQAFDHEVPILIVGGGPSGLLLAYMLAQLNSAQSATVSIYSYTETPHSSNPHRRALSHQISCTKSTCALSSIFGIMSPIRYRCK